MRKNFTVIFPTITECRGTGTTGTEMNVRMMSDSKPNSRPGPDYHETPVFHLTPGFLSILCVFDNLILLDRICHGLEGKGNIFVEVAMTVEDALGLIRYIDFDLIVCETLSGRIDSNRFLRSARDAGILTPFIVYSNGLEEEDEKTSLTCSPVYFLRQGPITPSEIDILHSLIMQISSRERRH